MKSAQKRRSEKRFCALFVYSVIKYYTFIITSVVVLGPWSWSRGASRTCLGGLGLGLGLALSGLGLGHASGTVA